MNKYLMKYSLSIFLIVFIFLCQEAISQQKTIFVGEIHGTTIDSFLKIQVNPYRDFKLPPISASSHKIEIRLFEGLHMGSFFCTILTYDTGFERKAYTLDSWEDTLNGPKEIMVPQKGLDSIFDQLVASGVFSIGSSNRGDIKKNYRPWCLGPSGLESPGPFVMGVGAYYFLQFKVDKYYSQVGFDNPEFFGSFFRDNQMLRRQKEIVSAIKAGMKKWGAPSTDDLTSGHGPQICR